MPIFVINLTPRKYIVYKSNNLELGEDVETQICNQHYMEIQEATCYLMEFPYFFVSYHDILFSVSSHKTII